MPMTGRRQSSIADLLNSQKLPMTSTLHDFRTDILSYDPKPSRDPETELYILIKEAEMYKFTAEELHIALKYCSPDTHPVRWLRENWPKLITTVQSLATKYGQERAENNIGTVSQLEARDALRLHAGNIWRAVSECIEQRQRKFRELSMKGNFNREDIVTALTTHQGNLELAFMDLTKNQLTPFLMRIWGSPGGVENESALLLPYTPLNNISVDIGSEEPFKPEIHAIPEFLQTANAADSFMRDHASKLLPDRTHNNSRQSTLHPLPPSSDNLSNYSADSKDNVSSVSLEDPMQNNKSVLKDLEKLIGNMEQKQAKQNEEVLKSIEGLLENLLNKKEQEIESEAGATRISVKSPIIAAKSKLDAEDATDHDAGIKKFVWDHIQDVVPNLVQQAQMQLLEQNDSVTNDVAINEESKLNQNSNAQPPPVNAEEFIMEEVIVPNLKEAVLDKLSSIVFEGIEELEPFHVTLDQCIISDYETEFQYESFKDAKRNIYRLFRVPEHILKNSVEEFKDENSIKKEQPTTSKEALERSLEKTNQSLQNILTSTKTIYDNAYSSKMENIQVQLSTVSNGRSVNEPTTRDVSSIENETMETNKRTGRFRKSKIPVRKSGSNHSLTSLRSLNSGGKRPKSSEQLSQNTIQTMEEITLKTAGEENDKQINGDVESDTVENDKISDAEHDINQPVLLKNSTTEIMERLIEENVESQQTPEIGAKIEDHNHTDIDENLSLQLSALNSNENQVEKALEVNTLVHAASDSDIVNVTADEQSHSSSPVHSETQSSVSTIASSYKYKSKPSTEFIPSADPSKQNLSELVEDTQRLIKQMKDEISMDEFDSSEDDEYYSDEYSDEYTYSGEEEEWDEDAIDEEETIDDEEPTDLEDETISEYEEENEITENAEVQNSSKVNIQQELVIDRKDITHDTANITDIVSINHISSLAENTSHDINESLINTAQTVNDASQLSENNAQEEVSSSKITTEPEINILTDDATPEHNDLDDQEEAEKLQSHSVSVEKRIQIISAESSATILEENPQSKDIILSDVIQERETTTNHSLSENELKITAPATDQDLITKTHENIEINQKSISNNANLDADKPTTSAKSQLNEQTKTKAATKPKSVNSKIPKPKETTPKNNPQRSKSFAGAMAPIGISTVKSLQQRFLNNNKSSQLSTTKTTPTVVRKKSITEAITKLTQPSSSDHAGPSTSTGIYRGHTRIPKKKYHETCFSDDNYESSSNEEEPEPIEIRQRKQSVPVFRSYASVQEPDPIDPDV